MLSMPKNVLGVILLLAGLAALSGCASRDADVASLERQLAAKEARIEELKMSKADMLRVIELKNADLKRRRKASLQAQQAAATPADGALHPPCATPRIVRRIQSALKRKNYYHGAIDGILGPQTERAIQSYQRANGLDIGGLTYETQRSLGLVGRGRQVMAGGT